MVETGKLGKKSHQNNTLPQKKAERTPTWRGIRALFSHKPHHSGEARKRCGMFGCSVSLCSTKESFKVPCAHAHHRKSASVGSPADHKKLVSVDVYGGNTRSSTKSHENDIDVCLSSSFHSVSTAVATSSSSASASSSSLGGSFRGMHQRRFSGCFEYHSTVNPVVGVSRVPSSRIDICTCPDCGDIFTKSDSLELHQAMRHAVTELDPENTSRNIVEIIFQSSWVKKQSPPCKVDRILKINNPQTTIARFEDYRDYVKTRAGSLAWKHPRCTADGNELLRFHCTGFACSSVGSNNRSTGLCCPVSRCNACSIVRDGFRADGAGRIRTMATSAGAHNAAGAPSSVGGKWAMLVCRVIAGGVKKDQGVDEEHDSFTGPAEGTCSDLEELFVCNPDAILPCFLVVYGGFF